MIDEGVSARFELLERGAGHALTVIDELLHVVAQGYRPETTRNGLELGLGGIAGGNFRKEIRHHDVRMAHIRAHQPQQAFVQLASRK